MPINDLPCPVTRCLAFEILEPKMYPSEGGGHILAIAFASEEPQYPGLRLERPIPLPTTTGKDPKFYRPDESLQRLPGTLYTFIAMVASDDIYAPARNDLESLLKSLVIDTK